MSQHSSEPARVDPRPALPRWKRAVFMAITLSLPLVFLLLAEGILRLAGQGGYPPFFRQAGTLPSGPDLPAC